MLEMFWTEKYVMAAGVTLIVQRLFGWRGMRGVWLCAGTISVAVISMNIGAGLMYPYGRNWYFFGTAEGVFAGSLLLLIGMIWNRIRKAVRKEHRIEEASAPGEEQIAHYTKAFTDLAKSFLSVPSGNVPAVVGVDDFQKVHAVWNARMDEQRVAVATQLTEISGIMEGAVRRAYDTKEDTSLEKQLKKKLHKKGIYLKTAYVYENEKHKKEVYLNIRARKKGSISNKNAAECLSEVLEVNMMPSHETRAFVRNEYTNTCFVERTNFEVLYGVERSVGDYQQISGDSFSFLQKEDGQFLASLSDGMGKGLNAYQESEKVVDLLEQFLEAGFTKETAVKMINSALILKAQGKSFSTIDISSIDLYSGVCEFLKIGAAASFIRRGNFVEVISSTSLPAGIFQQTDVEKTCRKLYDGDMVIMVTDGVLDVLPPEHQEKLMKDIILEHSTNNPKELAEYILSRVKQYKNGRFLDDMTILVMGIWKR